MYMLDSDQEPSYNLSKNLLEDMVDDSTPPVIYLLTKLLTQQWCSEGMPTLHCLKDKEELGT